jgi:hypothetical protein
MSQAAHNKGVGADTEAATYTPDCARRSHRHGTYLTETSTKISPTLIPNPAVPREPGLTSSVSAPRPTRSMCPTKVSAQSRARRWLFLAQRLLLFARSPLFLAQLPRAARKLSPGSSAAGLVAAEGDRHLRGSGAVRRSKDLHIGACPPRRGTESGIKASRDKGRQAGRATSSRKGPRTAGFPAARTGRW